MVTRNVFFGLFLLYIIRHKADLYIYARCFLIGANFPFLRKYLTKKQLYSIEIVKPLLGPPSGKNPVPLRYIT